MGAPGVGVAADSVSAQGALSTTIEATLHRFVLAELGRARSQAAQLRHLVPT